MSDFFSYKNTDFIFLFLVTHEITVSMALSYPTQIFNMFSP